MRLDTFFSPQRPGNSEAGKFEVRLVPMRLTVHLLPTKVCNGGVELAGMEYKMVLNYPSLGIGHGQRLSVNKISK